MLNQIISNLPILYPINIRSSFKGKSTSNHSSIAKVEKILKNNPLKISETTDNNLSISNLNKSSSQTKKLVSHIKSFATGTVIWAGLKGLVLIGAPSREEVLRILLNDCIQSSSTSSKIEALKIEALKMWGTINPDAVLNASCPKQEFLKQLSLIDPNLIDVYYNTPPSVYIFWMPVIEELVFRGLLQDLVFKRLVGKIIKTISPQHAGVIDSKIYTACRVLLTSALFSCSHLANIGIFPDEYVAQQVTSTLIMGLWFGTFKERWGMESAIGAHMVQNFFASYHMSHIFTC